MQIIRFQRPADEWSQPVDFSVTTRRQERDDIAQQVQTFLKTGGKITILPSGISTDLPTLSAGEKRVLKILHLRNKAKPVAGFPESLIRAIADLNHKHLLWCRDGLVDLTTTGRYAAGQLFNVAGLAPCVAC